MLEATTSRPTLAENCLTASYTLEALATSILAGGPRRKVVQSLYRGYARRRLSLCSNWATFATRPG